MNLRVRHPVIDLEEVERGVEYTAQADQPGIDITALLRIIRARKGVILATVAAVVGLTLVAWLFITPTYSATAVLMLDQRKNAVADVNAVLSGLPTDSAASVQNEIQVLTSRQLALRVVDKLELDRDPEFNAAINSGFARLFGWGSTEANLPLRRDYVSKDREAAMNRLMKLINVEQVGLSTTMTVSVPSVDAEKSATLTNAVADAYVEDQLNAKFEATKKASSWLSERARQMASQVQEDEAAVQKYKAENGIVSTPTGSIVDQQTVSVSVQLINAKADLAQKSALYNRVLELRRSGRAVDISQVVASPLISQLRATEADLQRQEAQLSARYLAEHPKMIDIQSQRREARSKIGAEVSRVVDSLSNDVAVARANVESLQTSLDQLQTKFQAENGASAKLKALESIASSSRSIYEGLLGRLKEVQGQEGIANADARVISRAMAPTTASPRFLVVMGVALPASLVLGLLLAFAVEGLDPSLRTTEHIDKFLGLPVLGTIPEVPAQNTSHPVADLVVQDPSSSFAEGIRGLYLGLSLANVSRAPKVLLVTSAVPAEGKTVVATSLARLAARSGRRVIIIDADFRRPAVTPTMGVAASAGIVDVLDGRLPLERCIVNDPSSQAVILPGAQRSTNPSDLITSNVLEKLIATLRGEYDLIIVDSAPLLPVHDTLALSEFCDAALFVTQSGKTSRDAVVAALRMLKGTKVTVSGVALTRVKLDPRYEYQEYLYGSYLRTEGASQGAARRKRLAAPATVAGKLRSLVFQEISDRDA